MYTSSLGALIVVAFAASANADDSPAKKFTCASCHREEARSQPLTPMGIGLQLPPDQILIKANPKLTVENNGYTYTVERKGDVSTYTVSDGSGSLTLPIRYAFGVHMQTYVLEREGRFYESLVSYYPPVGGLAATMGDERIKPRNLVEAMGRETSEQEIVACFGCHSSGAVSQGRLNLEKLTPGLNCEHCHPGANAHMEALSLGKQTSTPKKLGQLSSEETSAFCGACHRSWDTVIRMRIWGQVNVRFQPYRLANSKCFLGNDKRIACTACHNPHVDLVRGESSYDSKCLACHVTGGAKVASKPKPCPVSGENCVTCHMPKVELPGSHAVFTDHDIRIVRAGEAYPN